MTVKDIGDCKVPRQPNLIGNEASQIAVDKDMSHENEDTNNQNETHQLFNI